MLDAVPTATSGCRPAAGRLGSDPAAPIPGILATIASPKPIAGQHVLFREGDAAVSLFEVVRGVLRLYRLLPDGRRSITGFAFPGSLLGLSFRDIYVYTAETLTPCEIRQCERSAAAKLMDTGSDFRRQLLAIVSDELCSAQDQMVLLGRKSASEKVVSFLLWAARKMHGEQADQRYVDLPMSRTDIADYLGLTTETVSREMTKLRQAGLLDLPTPQRVHLLRRDALREIAESGEVEVKEMTGKFKPARWPS